MVDAGKVVVTLRGDYSPIEVYDFLDCVYYEYGTYCARKPTSGNIPVRDSEHWKLLCNAPGVDRLVMKTTIASLNELGVIKPDGETITISPDGTISGVIASPEAIGVLKVDGTTLIADDDGTLRVSPDYLESIDALMENKADSIGYNAQSGLFELKAGDKVLQSATIKGGSTAIRLADVSGASITLSHSSANITWSDPSDVVLEGITLASWAGTKVVRKVGSAPSHSDDDVLVVNSVIKNQYSSTPFTDTGLEYDTVYYYRFFPYTADGNETDGGTISITPVREVISEIPTQSGTLVYNGVELTASFNGYDPVAMSVTGNTATNAGEYMALFTPNDGYCWNDGTLTAKEVSWTIDRAVISAIPTQDGELVYNANPQSPAWIGYNEDEMTIGGVTSSVDAGSFVAEFTPTDNYKWVDGSVTAKSANWTINRATVDISVSSPNVTLDSDNPTANVTVGNVNGRALTVTSSNSGVATGSVEGNIVTVNNVNEANGEAVLTVNAAQSVNYNEASVQIRVTASFVAIVSWSSGTDEEIVAMVEAADAKNIDLYEYWSIGDERIIHLSKMYATDVSESHVEQDTTWVLMGKGHYYTLTTARANCFEVGMKNCLSNYGYMNSTNSTTNGWRGCKRRAWCNHELKNAIPSTLVNIFKQFRCGSINSNTNTSIVYSDDYFALPAVVEVFGSTSAGYKDEGKQWEYYTTLANRIKYTGNGTGSAYYWWLRSIIVGGNSGYFHLVRSNGSSGADGASIKYGISPFGCI